MNLRQLEIITMNVVETLFTPVNMLEGGWESFDKFTSRICSTLENVTENFRGLGKMNGYQVKHYTNKPIAVSPPPILYHLKARVDDVTESMIKEGVIEEHPPNGPSNDPGCS